ncbi:MAG: hypothetical protein WBC22_01505 [Sedimentisphaerales bacterium]
MNIKVLIRSIVLAVVALVSLNLSTALAEKADNAGRIKPWHKDTRYWQYKGKPVLLLGGSLTDHIFLLEGLKAHLDEMVSVGANYVRNTMSQREGVELKAHKLLDNGKFDMDQWNPEYWKRFENCLKWTLERDIIMQIEVWDRFDYSQEQWDHSPWNPANNVNYDFAQSGLARKYPAPAWRDRHPFFHTILGMAQYKPMYDLIRKHQERFVAKMLSHSLKYPNVLYCMNNETSTDPVWGRDWMRFIETRAVAEGAEIYVTDMFDDAYKPQTSVKLRQAFDDPEVYEFMDVSQVNSRTFNEDHWTNVFWINQQNGRFPRPLNNTKIYSDGQLNFGTGTPVDGVERFWRNLIAGCASCRFHRPTAGIGLNDIAKTCILAARKIESIVPFQQVEPKMNLLGDRESDEAYIATGLGAFIIYFTDDGSVTVDFSADRGKLKLQWVNITTGDWGPKTIIDPGKAVKISAPGPKGWAAAITSR